MLWRHYEPAAGTLVGWIRTTRQIPDMLAPPSQFATAIATASPISAARNVKIRSARTALTTHQSDRNVPNVQNELVGS